MRLIELDQGSPEWLTWRSKGLGASDAAAILGLSPWTSRAQLMEKKLREIRLAAKGKMQRKPENAPRLEPDNGAMARGRRLEPVARDLYVKKTGRPVRPVCVIHDDLPWLRASLDGLTYDDQIVVEIKAPNFRDHREALEGNVPLKYEAQLQHQLLVTGLDVAHYWSYSDNLNEFPDEGQRTALVEVKAMPRFQAMILEAETIFWKELNERLQEPSWLADG